MPEQPLIVAQEVWFAYADANWTLRDVTLRIAAGEYVAIIGRNGAGKTTLAKLCNGLLLPTRGHVHVLGQDTASLRPHQLASAVGYVFQNPDHQIFSATTREEIAFGPRNLGLSEAEVHARTEEALTRFGLRQVADAPPALLGFALRRKVALAAVYSMRPRALILDEPTGGLDRDTVRDVMGAVADLHAEGHTIILITHDMALAAGQAQRIILLHEGQTALDATPRETFAQNERLRAAGLASPQITRLARRLTPHGLPADLLTVDEFVTAYTARAAARHPHCPPRGAV